MNYDDLKLPPGIDPNAFLTAMFCPQGPEQPDELRDAWRAIAKRLEEELAYKGCAYLSLDYTESTLDGDFTSDELRRIADTMDAFKKEWGDRPHPFRREIIEDE